MLPRWPSRLWRSRRSGIALLVILLVGSVAFMPQEAAVLKKTTQTLVEQPKAPDLPGWFTSTTPLPAHCLPSLPAHEILAGRLRSAETAGLVDYSFYGNPAFTYQFERAVLEAKSHWHLQAVWILTDTSSLKRLQRQLTKDEAPLWPLDAYLVSSIEGLRWIVNDASREQAMKMLVARRQLGSLFDLRISIPVLDITDRADCEALFPSDKIFKFGARNALVQRFQKRPWLFHNLGDDASFGRPVMKTWEDMRTQFPDCSHVIKDGYPRFTVTASPCAIEYDSNVLFSSPLFNLTAQHRMTIQVHLLVGSTSPLVALFHLSHITLSIDPVTVEDLQSPEKACAFANKHVDAFEEMNAQTGKSLRPDTFVWPKKKLERLYTLEATQQLIQKMQCISGSIHLSKQSGYFARLAIDFLLDPDMNPHLAAVNVDFAPPIGITSWLDRHYEDSVVSQYTILKQFVERGAAPFVFGDRFEDWTVVYNELETACPERESICQMMGVQRR